LAVISCRIKLSRNTTFSLRLGRFQPPYTIEETWAIEKTCPYSVRGGVSLKTWPIQVSVGRSSDIKNSYSTPQTLWTLSISGTLAKKEIPVRVKVDRAIVLGRFSFDERNKIHSPAPLLRAMVQAFWRCFQNPSPTKRV